MPPRLLLTVLLALWAPAAAVAACAGAPGSEQPPRFALSGGEARDGRTGLVWQRCSVGTAWQDAACAGERRFMGLAEARRAAKAAGGGWRLPTVAELADLLDEGCGGPFLDPAIFPDLAASEDGDDSYWTASAMGVANLFYYVDVAGGQVDAHSPGFSLAVRLVRPGR